MLHYRKYNNYEEYCKHQASKLAKGIKNKQKNFMPKDFERIKNAFKDRLKPYIEYLKEDCGVICLGARLGMEVAAFREYGFSKAIGIDLNPGPWQDKDSSQSMNPVVNRHFHHKLLFYL